MIKIKCPFCGSTSQPKLQLHFVNDSNSKIIDEYECGCGCMFDVVTTITNVRFLDFDEEDDY